MSHHGNNPPHVQKALSEALRSLLGEYPDGRMNANDEGAIAFAVGVEAGRVVLRFPKPVAWMGMSGDEARREAAVTPEEIRKRSAGH